MPVLTQLNLNIGTEQNPNMVLHDLHDIRISSTDVNTVTRLLGCDAGVNSIAPITLANAASLLGGQSKFREDRATGTITSIDGGIAFCIVSKLSGDVANIRANDTVAVTLDNSVDLGNSDIEVDALTNTTPSVFSILYSHSSKALLIKNKTNSDQTIPSRTYFIGAF